MAIEGTIGDDQLNGTSRADVINAGAGDDHIASGAGADTVDGGDGDDKIDAGGGDDTLIGGAGDDFLNGGGGSDTFVFHFTLSGSGGATISFENGIDQNDFRNEYEAFLEENGIDADTWQQNSQTDPVPGNDDATVESVVLSNDQTRYYENTVGSGGSPTITASDGNDTIAQFHNSGPNIDTIELHGLASLEGNDALIDTLFDLSVSDANNDGINDTVLSWNGGSITILGTSEWGTDVIAFFNDDRVELLA
jgi:hypothetical protein